MISDVRTAPRENLARCCSGGSLTWGWRAAAGQGGSRRGDSRPHAALTTHRRGPAVWMPAGPASMGAVSGCRAALRSRSRITTLCERGSPEGPAPWIPSVVRVERSLHQKPPCPLPCPPSCVRLDPVSLPAGRALRSDSSAQGQLGCPAVSCNCSRGSRGSRRATRPFAGHLAERTSVSPTVAGLQG